VVDITQQEANKRTTTDLFGRQTLRSSRDALLRRAAEQPDLAWRLLATLNTFRILISLALLILFQAGGEPRVFGDLAPAVFQVTTGMYLIFAIISAFSLSQRWVEVSV